MKYYWTTFFIITGNDKQRKRKVKDFLNAFETGRKYALRYALLARYPNAVDSEGNISNDFQECINKYRRPYIKGERVAENDIVFINWNKNNYYDLKCLQMLKMIMGGVSDFITDLIMEIFEPAFSEPYEIPKLTVASEKKTTKKKEVKPSAPKEISPIVSEPVEIPDNGITKDIGDEYYSSAEDMELLNRTLAQFDAELMDKAKNKNTP